MKPKTYMKTNLLLIAAVAAVATFTGNAKADDANLSPKAIQMAQSSAKGSGTTTDMLNRSVNSGSPKAVAFAESLRQTSGTTSEKLVRNAGPASPRALANNPSLGQQIQVAPLK